MVNFSKVEQQSDQLEFGWAIVRPGQQQPTQTSQTVLVSVPAYLNRLTIFVQTGWLDPGSNFQKHEEFEMTVALPADYEALDGLIGGDTVPKGPSIGDVYPLILTACSHADILIPGERLWRWSTVTLASKIADKDYRYAEHEGHCRDIQDDQPPPWRHGWRSPRSSCCAGSGRRRT